MADYTVPDIFSDDVYELDPELRCVCGGLTRNRGACATCICWFSRNGQLLFTPLARSFQRPLPKVSLCGHWRGSHGQQLSRGSNVYCGVEYVALREEKVAAGTALARGGQRRRQGRVPVQVG
jgi:hypothetical protein